MKQIHCQEPWFSKIKHGIKKIEGRKNSATYGTLKPGETVQFYCDQDSFFAEVVDIIVYPTLEDYLITEGIQHVLPGIASFQDAVNVYLKFNSREELEKCNGFLAIHVKVI